VVVGAALPEEKNAPDTVPKPLTLQLPVEEDTGPET